MQLRTKSRILSIAISMSLLAGMSMVAPSITSATAAPRTCAQGGACQIGEIGPGGGKIVYINRDVPISNAFVTIVDDADERKTVTFTTRIPHGLTPGVTLTVSGIVGTGNLNVTNKEVVAVLSPTVFTIANDESLISGVYSSGGLIAKNGTWDYLQSAPSNWDHEPITTPAVGAIGANRFTLNSLAGFKIGMAIDTSSSNIPKLIVGFNYDAIQIIFNEELTEDFSGTITTYGDRLMGLPSETRSPVGSGFQVGHGKTNTDAIFNVNSSMDVDYNAAKAVRSYGADWDIPSVSELAIALHVLSSSPMNGFIPNGDYLSSTIPGFDGYGPIAFSVRNSSFAIGGVYGDINVQGGFVRPVRQLTKIKEVQSQFVLPAKLAKGKTYSINAKNKQNLAVNVKAAGKCSVTKVYKKISGKNVLQSFKVTAAKQVGTCKVTITSPANNVYKAFSQTKNIAIK